MDLKGIHQIPIPIRIPILIPTHSANQTPPGTGRHRFEPCRRLFFKTKHMLCYHIFNTK
ncbi:hypothetical protein HanRHA438_Chr14g0653201 [Helianthus annuus]|nr:hypothetical protein HanRHA438_Chr14g0653201 [Helianthus annuus]